MENLERDAKLHFEKLNGTIAYNERRLEDPAVAYPVKLIIKKEILMLQFMAQYAVEALEKRGIHVG